PARRRQEMARQGRAGAGRARRQGGADLAGAAGAGPAAQGGGGAGQGGEGVRGGRFTRVSSRSRGRRTLWTGGGTGPAGGSKSALTKGRGPPVSRSARSRLSMRSNKSSMLPNSNSPGRGGLPSGPVTDSTLPSLTRTEYFSPVRGAGSGLGSRRTSY